MDWETILTILSAVFGGLVPICGAIVGILAEKRGRKKIDAAAERAEFKQAERDTAYQKAIERAVVGVETVVNGGQAKEFLAVSSVKGDLSKTDFHLDDEAIRTDIREFVALTKRVNYSPAHPKIEVKRVATDGAAKSLDDLL